LVDFRKWADMSGALQAIFSNNRGGTVYPAIAMTVDDPPGINVFRFNGNQIGTKYPDPAGFSDTTFQVAWANLPGSNTTDIAVTSFNTPYIHAWAWNYDSGFGSKYADPATLPTGTARGVDFFGNGSTQVYDIAVSYFGSPYVSVYPWTTGVGFGSKYANPATLPGSGFTTAEGVNFRYTAGGSQIAVANEGASPFVFVYPWTTGVGFGSKYADPATLPTGATEVAFAEDVIAVSHTTSPYVSVYPFSTAGGFGSKYANPGTLPTGAANDVSWYNLSAEAIAVAHDNSPYVSVYPFLTATGFGTKYSNPSTLPTGNGQSVDFTAGVAAGSRSLAVGHANSPYVSVYPFSLPSFVGIGTKSADFTTLPPDTVKNVKFSPNS
jgi:hypothetical protein